MRRSTILRAVMILSGLCLVARAGAGEPAAVQPYSGGLWSRSTLSGDWGGLRNTGAGKGVTFEASVTQIEQGVVAGGKSGSWQYGGRANLTGNLDTGKLGLWPGGFLKVELEGNWSDSVNPNTGALLAANTNQLLPVPMRDNVALPELSFTQFLSPYAGLIVGKLETMGGDANAFAHGKGDTQFFNLAFNINPVDLVMPYSTLGAGMIALPTKDPNEAIVTFLVASATGTASTAGFDSISGAIFAAEGRVRTGFFGRTGHQLVGALYSNRKYTSVDQRLGFIIGIRPLATQDGTWAVYYNFDQFLYETDAAAGRGVGLFGRFGASKGDPNPVQYFFSAGVGGKGLFPGRERDQCGIGYYYSSINNPTLRHPLFTRSFLRDEWGFEAYYNLALTAWLLVTPDLQVIGPAQKQRFSNREYVGTATVLGLRTQLIF